MSKPMAILSPQSFVARLRRLLVLLCGVMVLTSGWIYLLMLEREYRLPCPINGTMVDTSVEVVIMTIPREQPYLSRTLQSLQSSDFGLIGPHYNFMVGVPDSDYLEDVKSVTKSSAYPIPMEEWRLIQDLPIRLRGFYNYFRCLSKTVVSSPVNMQVEEKVMSGQDGAAFKKIGRLVIEDDVIVKKTFWARLQQVLNQIWRDYGRNHRFVLSLYQSRRFYPASVYGLYLQEKSFSRSQVVFFPMSVMEDISTFMESWKESKDPYDIELGRFCWRNNIPIYVLTRPPVQHIGFSTTGLGTCVHQSSTFDYEDDWFCPSATKGE